MGLLLLAVCSCQKPEEMPGPLGLPALRVKARPSGEEVALGKKLFFDTRLSGDNSISCASCHNPEQGFADGRRVSVGVGGMRGRRNSPTVLNAAYGRVQFWDGRAGSLEEQAAGPIGNDLEMNHKPELLLAKLRADPAYGADFTMKKLVGAIASYERTLLSGNSAFDRYQYGGDKTALTDIAVHGLAVFKTHCASCHTIGPRDALFTDQKFHNVGVGVDSSGELTDMGRGRGEFKTPTLRNVARTAPYMHNGSLKSLRQVIEFYVGGGNSNPYLDPLIKPLELTNQDREGLLAFLESLNGDLPQ